MTNTEPDLAAMKRRLEEERQALTSASEETGDSRKPVALDQTTMGRLSRIDAMQNQAMAQESERRRQLRLKQIDAALRRIEADEYGFCLRCGEDIPPERLDFDPAAPMCVDCSGNR